MGEIQTSRKTPRNMSRNKKVSDIQAFANSDAFNYEEPEDQEYGNLGPMASAQAPDGNSETAAGANSGFGRSAATDGNDVYINNKSRATKPRRGNPHPGGGW